MCPYVTEAKTEPWMEEGKLALALSPLFKSTSATLQ